MSSDQQDELARKRAEIEEKRKNLERLRAEAAAKDRAGQLAELERRKIELLERKKDVAARKAENEKALNILQKTLSTDNLLFAQPQQQPQQPQQQQIPTITFSNNDEVDDTNNDQQQSKSVSTPLTDEVEDHQEQPSGTYLFIILIIFPTAPLLSTYLFKFICYYDLIINYF